MTNTADPIADVLVRCFPARSRVVAVDVDASSEPTEAHGQWRVPLVVAELEAGAVSLVRAASLPLPAAGLVTEGARRALTLGIRRRLVTDLSLVARQGSAFGFSPFEGAAVDAPSEGPLSCLVVDLLTIGELSPDRARALAELWIRSDEVSARLELLDAIGPGPDHVACARALVERLREALDLDAPVPAAVAAANDGALAVAFEAMRRAAPKRRRAALGPLAQEVVTARFAEVPPAALARFLARRREDLFAHGVVLPA